MRNRGKWNFSHCKSPGKCQKCFLEIFYLCVLNSTESFILVEFLEYIRYDMKSISFFSLFAFSLQVIVAVTCHLLNPSFPVHLSLCLDLSPRNLERYIYLLAEQQMCKVSGVFPADFTT